MMNENGDSDSLDNGIRQNIFRFLLVKDEAPCLASSVEPLRDTIAEHAQRHDFAQMVRHDNIHLNQHHIDGEDMDVVEVPFEREFFEDMPTLNWYVRARAAEVGLSVYKLMLPCGTIAN